MRGFTQTLLASACLSGAAMAAKLKIMPLGDSITEITCWRTLLWDDLYQANLTSQIQFVGSMTDNTQNCASKLDANWDKHHEGHSGYQAVNIANQNLQGWLSSTTPDIVMFMLGTNDVAQGKTLSDITAAYTKMVTEMRSNNPKVKIIVDTVIPLPLSQAGITAINNMIPTWAKGLNTTTSPIYIADIAPNFPTSDLRDGVHPNAAGDAIIASKLAPVLIPVIQASLGTSS